MYSEALNQLSQGLVQAGKTFGRGVLRACLYGAALFEGVNASGVFHNTHDGVAHIGPSHLVIGSLALVGAEALRKEN